jgi:ribosomal protein L37AE/L43A
VKKMADVFECPGASNIKAPTIEEIKCPKCGEELEIFTDETSIKCDSCGATVDRAANLQCIQWCEAAKECIGEEKYNELMGDKKNG